VSAGQKCDQCSFNNDVLADDDLTDFPTDSLQVLGGVFGLESRSVVHVTVRGAYWQRGRKRDGRMVTGCRATLPRTESACC